MGEVEAVYSVKVTYSFSGTVTESEVIASVAAATGVASNRITAVLSAGGSPSPSPATTATPDGTTDGAAADVTTTGSADAVTTTSASRRLQGTTAEVTITADTVDAITAAGAVLADPSNLENVGTVTVVEAPVYAVELVVTVTSTDDTAVVPPTAD